MAILVTGGAGYIGSHMVLALRERNKQVVVLDNLTTGSRAAVPDDVHFVQGEVSDQALVQQIIVEHGVAEVAHFAASISVPESVALPNKYYKNNTASTLELIEAVIEAGVKRFLFSSTAAVYGSPEADFIEETTPTNPESPYGASKLMSERILKDAAYAHGLSVAILRYFNVAGADPQGRSGQSNPNATHLMKMCVQAALGHKKGVQVYGTDYPTKDGSGVRDYIHVTDLVTAHVLALQLLETKKESITVNCGYGTGFSVFEVIEAVKRVSGVDFPVSIEPRRPGDPGSVVASGKLARQALGWMPEYDNLDLIVKHALEWERRISGTA